MLRGLCTETMNFMISMKIPSERGAAGERDPLLRVPGA